MAKRVEGITEKLIECAKQEFLEKGYDNASLRSIAEKADSSKGAIYIRYPDKAALFTSLVKDAADGLIELTSVLQGEFSELPSHEQKNKASEWSNKGFAAFTDYMYVHFDEFKLLLTSSENGMYQDFMHRLVEVDIESIFRYVQASGSDAIRTGRLTKEFAHLVSQAFYTGVFEVVIHDLPKEKATEHIDRLRRFYTAGWMTVF